MLTVKHVQLSRSPLLFAVVLLRSVFWVINQTTSTSVFFSSSFSCLDLFKPHSVSRTESIPPLLRGSSTRTSWAKLAPFGNITSFYTTCCTECSKSPEHEMLWEKLWLMFMRRFQRNNDSLLSLWLGYLFSSIIFFSFFFRLHCPAGPPELR